MEEHYYNARHSKFEDLGLVPNLLTDEVMDGMLAEAQANCSQVNDRVFIPRIPWAANR